MGKSKLLSAVAFVSLAFVTPASASAQDIDTTGGAPLSDYWHPFGSPDTATYGQTFTAGVGQNVLQSFSLFLGSRVDGSAPLSLKGYFGTWLAGHVGSILYASGTQVTNGNQEFDFNTGGLNLNLGDQYVAFLSISDLGPQPTSNFNMPQANAPLAGGNFVYLNNGTNFSQLTTSTWASAEPDVAFKAKFGGSIGAVPEPATWAMLLIGFFAVGGTMRMKRQKCSVSVSYA